MAGQRVIRTRCTGRSPAITYLSPAPRTAFHVIKRLVIGHGGVVDGERGDHRMLMDKTGKKHLAHFSHEFSCRLISHFMQAGCQEA